MPNAFTRFLRRMMAAPRATFRLAFANAMFVVLVAKELVIPEADE